MMARFNLNNPVTVTLTEIGVEVYQTYQSQLCPLSPADAALKPGDKIRIQHWRMMHIFGEHIFIGKDPPFSMTIEIDDEDLH